MTTIALFIMLFVFMMTGMPIAVALGLSSVLTIMFFGQASLASMSLKLLNTSEHYTLLAIPFFILSGAFMTTGGVARRMVLFANACIGHLRGGLGMASVLACMLFAAVSGSSPATVVAVGSIVIAGMVRSGYTKEFAAGVICNAGTLGILIPPSIVIVVYAAATESSVGRLFMAGVIPGILLGLMLMIAIYVRALKLDLPKQPRATIKEIILAGRNSLWGLLLLGIILGGIYGGIFTPTEAAAVAAMYAFFIAVFVYRDVKFSQVPKVLLDAAKVTVMLMFLIANALLFAYVLTTERIPQEIAEQIISMGMAPWQFLLVVSTNTVTHRKPVRYRSYPHGDHYGGQSGNWYGDPTGRIKFVCYRRYNEYVYYAGSSGGITLVDCIAGFSGVGNLYSRAVFVAAEFVVLTIIP